MENNLKRVPGTNKEIRHNDSAFDNALGYFQNTGEGIAKQVT